VLLLVSMSLAWSPSLYPTRCASTGHQPVAVGEPSQLNDMLGIDDLSKCDPKVALVHLDPQVEGEKPQVTHLVGVLYLFLERCHLCILDVGDHQVIDVDTHQQGVSSIAPPVDGHLVWALAKAHSLKRGV
jgi:hypothetical protein